MVMRRIYESVTFPEYYKDLKNWPTVLLDRLDSESQQLFLQRKKAIELYYQSQLQIPQILHESGLTATNFRRLLKRCIQLHPDGQIWGFRALIPHKRINSYASKNSSQHDTSKTIPGSFIRLLEKYPSLKLLIDNTYLKREAKRPNEPIIKVKHLHKKFVDECRKLGIQETEYPLNTKNVAKRSLERYVKGLENAHFSEAVKRHGSEAVQIFRGTGVPSSYTPPIIRPLERVQFDGHKIDLLASITFTTPEGDEIVEVLHRIWLLVIIDVATRVVLGHYLSLNKEYTASDVLQCIRNTILPRNRKVLTIPGLQYDERGGLPSDCLPELHWAVWDEFLYDNGKANLAHVVTERLTQIVNCSINAGPVALPMRRSYIERFFGTLEENGYHRLPTTTGNKLTDPRRQSPEKQAVKYWISYDHLEEITEVLISNYNGTPHEGLNNLSPLEVMRQRLGRGMLPRIMPEEQRNDAQFLTIRIQRTVKGSIKDGRRPYIFYEGVEYRSEVLARSPQLIGQSLELVVNTDDLRVIKAFLTDGSEFGSLVAHGKWGVSPHNLQIRKQINKLRQNKTLHYLSSECPIEAYQRYLEGKAKTNKSSRNKLEQINQLKKNHTEADEQITMISKDSILEQNVIPASVEVHRNELYKKRFKTLTY